MPLSAADAESGYVTDAVTPLSKLPPQIAIRIVVSGDGSVGWGQTGGADCPGTRVAVADGKAVAVAVTFGPVVGVTVTVGNGASTAPWRRTRGLTAVTDGPATTEKTKQSAVGVGVGVPTPAVVLAQSSEDRLTISGVPFWRSICKARVPSVAVDATVSLTVRTVPSSFMTVLLSSTASSGSAAKVVSFRNRTCGIRPVVEKPWPVTVTVYSVAPSPTVFGETSVNPRAAFT